MPCISYDKSEIGNGRNNNHTRIIELEKIEAILCAVCTRLQELNDAGDKLRSIFDSALLNAVDWKEAGVSKAHGLTTGGRNTDNETKNVAKRSRRPKSEKSVLKLPKPNLRLKKLSF